VRWLRNFGIYEMARCAHNGWALGRVAAECRPPVAAEEKAVGWMHLNLAARVPHAGQQVDVAGRARLSSLGPSASLHPPLECQAAPSAFRGLLIAGVAAAGFWLGVALLLLRHR